MAKSIEDVYYENPLKKLPPEGLFYVGLSTTHGAIQICDIVDNETLLIKDGKLSCAQNIGKEGSLYLSELRLSALSADSVLITDKDKNIISYFYSEKAIPNSIVFRDENANTSIHHLSCESLKIGYAPRVGSVLLSDKNSCAIWSLLEDVCVTEISCDDGQLFIDKKNGLVNITLSQPVDKKSSPEFTSLHLSSLDEDSFLFAGNDKKIKSISLIDYINVDPAKLSILSLKKGRVQITISPDYIGQTSIEKIGNVKVGKWSAEIIASEFGGTGRNNAGKTIELVHGKEGDVLSADQNGSAHYIPIHQLAITTINSSDKSLLVETENGITNLRLSQNIDCDSSVSFKDIHIMNNAIFESPIQCNASSYSSNNDFTSPPYAYLKFKLPSGRIVECPVWETEE